MQLDVDRSICMQCKQSLFQLVTIVIMILQDILPVVSTVAFKKSDSIVVKAVGIFTEFSSIREVKWSNPTAATCYFLIFFLCFYNLFLNILHNFLRS